MSPDDWIDQDDQHPAVEKLDETLLKLNLHQKEIYKLRRRLLHMNEELAEREREIDFLKEIQSRQPEPPAWTREPLVTGGKRHRGTPVLMLADTHYGEVVQPDQVFGLNAYNNRIAEARTRALGEGAIRILREYLGSTYEYDGIVVACLGDLITGVIHQELAETNEDPVSVTVGYATDWLIGLLAMLADEFGRVHFTGIVGNHDRMGKKVPSKYRSQDSWTWVIYTNLARHFQSDDRFSFEIPTSAHALMRVYDLTFLMLHGNDDRGGAGISGAWAPVFRGDFKRSMRGLAASRGAKDPGLIHDITLLGHWHQRIVTPSFVISNTMKGYDEYAFTSSFPYTEPSQELLVVTPERGVTFGTPVWVMDRVDEGW